MKRGRKLGPKKFRDEQQKFNVAFHKETKGILEDSVESFIAAQSDQSYRYRHIFHGSGRLILEIAIMEFHERLKKSKRPAKLLLDKYHKLIRTLYNKEPSGFNEID